MLPAFKLFFLLMAHLFCVESKSFWGGFLCSLWDFFFFPAQTDRMFCSSHLPTLLTANIKMSKTVHVQVPDLLQVSQGLRVKVKQCIAI